MGKKKVVPHKPHEKWGEDKKAECAVAVLAHGSIKKAAEQCHISPKTLGHWTRHDDDFIELLDSIQSEKRLEHKHIYGLIVEKAQQITLEKLPGATAAQASLIACQAEDKALLLDGKPTSIRGDSESIKSLTAQFNKLAQDHQNIQNSVVSTQGGGTNG